jgi:hypothetical protein
MLDQASVSELSHVDAPRLAYSRALCRDSELMWVTAISWVRKNRKLIGRILGNLRRSFPGTGSDVEALAYQIAYESILKSLTTGNLDLFPVNFCGRLRHELIALCSGPEIDRNVDLELIADRDVVPGSPGTPWMYVRHVRVFDAGLMCMTKRQQKVWRQYLEGEPLSRGGTVSREDRGIRILNNGIQRVAQREESLL